MRVQVKFFAIFREMTGVKSESKEITDGATVEQLWNEYTTASPHLAKMRAAYAVNQKLVKGDHILRDGDQVGFLPPVSGGAKTLEHETTRKVRKPRKKSGASNDRHARKKNGGGNAHHARKKSVSADSRNSRMQSDALITRKRLDLASVVKRVEFPGAGAILVFAGVVRDNAAGKKVDHLEYEAYPEMAEQSLRDIIAEIHARLPDVHVAIAHRIGKLEISEASLIIAVSAPHRGEAYAASRYAIERVKAILPVWKKEFATDGAHWVEGPIAGELSEQDAERIVNESGNTAEK